ncbi:MAG: Hint domain-containing protein [Rhodospirillales bacterium]|nr:Hint domain-containing protein [Rhodospirillales bacterium]
MTTYTWNSSVGSGTWSNTANWSPAGTPGTADTAIISLTGTLLGGGASVGVLKLSGGTLGTSGDVLTAATADLLGGTSIAGTLDATLADFVATTSISGLLSATGEVTIGNTATGTVDLLGNAASSFSAGSLLAGGAAGVVGLLNAGAELFSVTGDATLGASGTGNLLVSGFGDAIGGNLVAGLNGGSSAAISVTGSGVMTVSGGATLGAGGTVTATIDTGTSLSVAGALLAGTGVGSQASIDVGGNGSIGGTLAVGGDVSLGAGGATQLVADNGGQINATSTNLATNRIYVGAHGTLTGQTSSGINANAILMSDGASLSLSGGAVATLSGATDATLATGTLGAVVNGVAMVSGASMTASAGQIIVGDGPSGTGVGTLSVATAGAVGGSVSDTSLILGYGAGDQGTLSVAGTSGNVSSAVGMTIGDGGVGAFTLRFGAGVTDSGSSVIAALGGSSGAAVVEDAGSTWGVVGTLTVGAAGAGTLTVGAGTLAAGATSNGAVSAAALVLGSATSGVGTILVEHSATVTDSGVLTVGGAGHGSVEIDAGSLSAGSIVLGDGVGAIGTLNLTGATSQLSGVHVIVGNSGSGAFILGSLAQYSVTGSTIDVGETLGASGTLQVGAGATLTMQSATLRLGVAGTGAANLAAGGVINVSGSLDIGSAGSGSGAVALAGGALTANVLNLGAASQISGFGSVAVSGASTNAGVIVASGGTLSVGGTGQIGGAGTLAVAGGAELDVLATPSTEAILFQSSGLGEVLGLHAPNFVASTIHGWQPGRTIDLFGVAHSGTQTRSYNATTHVLTVSDSGTVEAALTFDPTTTATTFNLVADSAGTGTDIVPCFAAGTRILTPRGEVAVEALHAGDLVALARGGTAAVRWVGRRQVDCRHHRRPQDVLPVRVRAGAFADGVPQRDLVLSPDHAVFADGVLVPVRYLLNGATIVQESVARVTYCHVELAAHDVLLAEGLACESYLDTGNREAFAQGGAAMQLHPDFARAVWARQGCAPLVVAGEALAALRRVLLARTGALGHARTRDAGLTVLVDGKPARLTLAAGSWRVALPRGAREVRIGSRRWVPALLAESGALGEGDSRALGVAVCDLRLDGQALRLDDRRLDAGWRAVEAEWRWTDGDGRIAVDGAGELEFTVAISGSYWLEPVAAVVRERWSA